MRNAMSPEVAALAQKLLQKFALSKAASEALAVRQINYEGRGGCNIFETLEFLKDWGLDISQVGDYPSLASRTRFTLDHQLNVMKECGVRRDLHCLNSYLQINRSFLFALKTHFYIPVGCDVLDRLCSTVSLNDPDSVRKRLVAAAGDPQHCYLEQVRLNVFKQFLMERLNCTFEDAEKIISIYPRNRHKSLKLTDQLINLVLECGLTKQKIVRNPYLLNSHPETFAEFLEKFPDIQSTVTRDLLVKLPRLSYMPWHNAVQIRTIMAEFGLSEEHLSTTAQIFTLSADTVRERLLIMRQRPEIWTLRHNRFFLNLVYSFKRTMQRVDYLKSMNFTSTSVSLMKAFYPRFQNYLNTGNDKAGTSDVVTYLSHVLVASKSTLRRQLQSHPYFSSVALSSIADCTDGLLQAGYSREQICYSVQICLYKRDVVLAAAESVHTYGRLADVDPRMALEVVLYYIERQMHFSGAGVFATIDSLSVSSSDFCANVPVFSSANDSLSSADGTRVACK